MRRRRSAFRTLEDSVEGLFEGRLRGNVMTEFCQRFTREGCNMSALTAMHNSGNMTLLVSMPRPVRGDMLITPEY